jgi:hypothetical protein
MKDLTSTCAWCGKRVSEDVEIFALGARARAGVDLRDVEGTVISLSLGSHGKTVHAIVPTNDSEAKQAGNDLMFVACSRRCAESLKEALQSDLNLFSSVEHIH